MRTPFALIVIASAGCATASTPKPPPVAASATAPPKAAAAPAPPAKTASAWVRQGAAHRAGGRPSEAEAAYNEAIRIDPDHPDVWFNLGNLQLAGRHFGEAREQYDRALKINPDDIDAKINRGYALMGLKQFEPAAKAFQAAIDQISGREEVWNGLGAARHRLGDDAGALEAFRRAHSLAPEDPRSRFNLGMQMSQPLLRGPADAAAYDEAIALLESYLAQPLSDPRDSNAKVRVAALKKAKKKLAR